MCKFPYYRRYAKDILGDCRHLSRADYGSYSLILDTMWLQEGARLRLIPSELARIAGVTLRRWPEVWGRLIRFFTVSEDGLWITQKRMTTEYEEALASTSKQKTKAAQRWGGRTAKEATTKERTTKEATTAAPKCLENNETGYAAAYAAASPPARAVPTPEPYTKESKEKLEVGYAASPPANRPEPSSDEQAKVAKGFEALAASLDRVVAKVAEGKRPPEKPKPVSKPAEPVYSPAEMRALERLFPTIPELPKRIAELVRWTERQGMKPNEQKLAIKRRLDKDVGEQRLKEWQQEAMPA